MNKYGSQNKRFSYIYKNDFVERIKHLHILFKQSAAGESKNIKKYISYFPFFTGTTYFNILLSNLASVFSRKGSGE